MMADEAKQQGRFSTPSSGRKWKARKTEDDEMIPCDGREAEFIPVVGGGGGDGDGKGGGAANLAMAMMEEQIKEMQNTIMAMTKEMSILKAENNELKDKHTNRLDKDKQDKETWGRGGQGRWWEDGRGDDDPWKNWTGKAKTSKEGDEIINDD